MKEIMALRAPTDKRGIRKIILDIERFTDRWENLANEEFEEEAKVGKLQELIPVNIWNDMAQHARSTKCYPRASTFSSEPAHESKN